MSGKLTAGQTVPVLSLLDVHHKEVQFPEPQGRTTHLQFRRFAGCPICNLHLQSFVQRIAEIERAGVREVVVFHSSDHQLLPYQGNFPFIQDPGEQVSRGCLPKTIRALVSRPKVARSDCLRTF